MQEDLVVTAGFKDHFSAHSESYARHRPGYPGALFEYLASLTTDHAMAWDCATGNGQVATGLAQYFREIVATDASSAQIESAVLHPNVSYDVRRAEASGLLDQCADLVTVGQAFHWFDQPAFLTEAQRVLKSGGVLAIWCYQLSRVSPQCDAIVDELYDGIVASYWPLEREQVDRAYTGTALPGVAITSPDFNLSADWQVDDMLGYLRTWSACKRYEAENGTDPVDQIENRLREAWGGDAREAVWPLPIKLSRME